MEKGNRLEVNQSLKPYKTITGSVNFPSLLAIPTDLRLPALFKTDLKRTAALVGVSITAAMENLNLARPMNGSQIMDLTDAIQDSCNEDNLSFEDLALFLQKLVRGEYGSNYESMDIAKFMEKFEIYRQERFETLQNIRHEHDQQYKCLPVNDRIGDMFPDNERKLHTQAMIQHMVNNSKEKE